MRLYLRRYSIHSIYNVQYFVILNGEAPKTSHRRKVIVFCHSSAYHMICYFVDQNQFIFIIWALISTLMLDIFARYLANVPSKNVENELTFFLHYSGSVIIYEFFLSKYCVVDTRYISSFLFRFHNRIRNVQCSPIFFLRFFDKMKLKHNYKVYSK